MLDPKYKSLCPFVCTLPYPPGATGPRKAYPQPIPDPSSTPPRPCPDGRQDFPIFSFLMLSPYSRAVFAILEASRSSEKRNVHRDEPHLILVVSVTFLESVRGRLRAASSCVKTNTFQQGVILTTLTHEMRFLNFLAPLWDARHVSKGTRTRSILRHLTHFWLLG